ncbi:unnamed protein product, partial [marine sediment metagenome]
RQSSDEIRKKIKKVVESALKSDMFDDDREELIYPESHKKEIKEAITHIDLGIGWQEAAPVPIPRPVLNEEDEEEDEDWDEEDANQPACVAVCDANAEIDRSEDF